MAKEQPMPEPIDEWMCPPQLNFDKTKRCEVVLFFLAAKGVPCGRPADVLITWEPFRGRDGNAIDQNEPIFMCKRCYTKTRSRNEPTYYQLVEKWSESQ